MNEFSAALSAITGLASAIAVAWLNNRTNRRKAQDARHKSDVQVASELRDELREEMTRRLTAQERQHDAERRLWESEREMLKARVLELEREVKELQQQVNGHE